MAITVITSDLNVTYITFMTSVAFMTSVTSMTKTTFTGNASKTDLRHPGQIVLVLLKCFSFNQDPVGNLQSQIL
jgi:hypothetical protein